MTIPLDTAHIASTKESHDSRVFQHHNASLYSNPQMGRPGFSPDYTSKIKKNTLVFHVQTDGFPLCGGPCLKKLVASCAVCCMVSCLSKVIKESECCHQFLCSLLHTNHQGFTNIFPLLNGSTHQLHVLLHTGHGCTVKWDDHLVISTVNKQKRWVVSTPLMNISQSTSHPKCWGNK